MKLQNTPNDIETRDSFEYVSYNRGDDSISKTLNTYRNWNEFGLQVEPIYNPDSENSDSNDTSNWWSTSNSSTKYIGTKALFNNVNAVFKGDKNSQLRYAMNAPLLDSQEVRNIIRSRKGCSIRELVEASEKGLMGRAIYDYSDFMYCKYLNQVSNNYLVTLRRFPYPAGDHINFTLWNGIKPDGDEDKVNKHLPDIGRLVTWMGTPDNNLEDILKYKVLMPYKEMTAEIQTQGGTAEDGGLLGSIMNMTSKDYISGAVRGSCGLSSINLLRGMVGGRAGRALATPPNSDWFYYKDEARPYGPVDVISKTHIRQGGSEGGLVFEQDISLTFDYELRSYDGINGRAAMLDLLGNILSVTYTNGRFWGGMIRNTGAATTNAYANLPIYNMKGNEDFNQIKDAFLNSLSQVGAAMNNGKPIGGISDVINMIKNMASNIGTVLLGGALNALGRPIKQGLNSLLSNDPVGLWHLTIGNPKHPILSMGNMILKDVEIQHYGPLGLDDFPTGIKVKVTLGHAMPRDKLRIEHMYGLGDNRIYMPMGKHVSLMYNNAEQYKSSKGSQVDQKRSQVDRNEEVTDSSVSKSTTQDAQSKYMKYFGLRDSVLIDKAAREGHMGSNKAKTTSQSDADLKAAVANSKSKSSD